MRSSQPSMGELNEVIQLTVSCWWRGGRGHDYDRMVVGGRREMEVTEISDILN